MKFAVPPSRVGGCLVVCLLVFEGCTPAAPPGGLGDVEKKFTDAKTLLEQNGATLTQKTYAMNQAGWAVDLSGKELKPETFDGLARLVSLSELILKGAKITDEQMAQIGNLRTLYVLDVSNTPVSDSGLAQLKQNSLSKLDVSGTKVTSTAIAALEKRYATDPDINPFFRKIQVKK